MPSVLSSTAASACEVRVEVADCGRLLELLSLVPDPRDPRGIRSAYAFATGLIRATGRTQIAPTLRWVARNPVRALLFLSQIG